MKWGKRRWAALVGGLLALAHGAAAQEPIPRAGLGTPAHETIARPRDTSLVRVVAQDPLKEKITSSDDYSKLVPAVSPDPRPYPASIYKEELTLTEEQARDLRIWRVVSEGKFFAAIAKDGLPSIMPERPLLPPGPPEPRFWPTMVTYAEPSYLCYGRMFFEQRNFERYGWDLGVIQAPIEAALFYGDLLALPIRWGLDPFRNFDCNTGLCLPGDPTPLMLYWLRVK